MDIYEELLKDSGNLKGAADVDASGLDDFFTPPARLPDQIKIGSLGDLSDFFRVSSDTLVHKAEKDLWRISENKKGEVVIERLFNPETKKPIKV
jgi:hypothetical protein